MADVTFENAGVLLETGIALGLNQIGKSSSSLRAHMVTSTSILEITM